MAWLWLFFAGLFEVAWAYGMKLSDGFTRLWPGVATLIAMGLSVALLSLAMRSLPLGTAYAVWTGIGVVGTFLVGLFLLGDPATPLRLAAAGLIVAGIVLMKLAS